MTLSQTEGSTPSVGTSKPIKIDTIMEMLMKENLFGTFRAMEVDETIRTNYPNASVKTMACYVKREFGKVFKTVYNKEDGTTTVTRVK